MGKTAVVLGATGLVGGHLLDQLIEDEAYSKIKIFGRNPVNKSHPKIEEYIIDLLTLENHKSKFTGDVVFCCIGTTKSKTKDKSKYRDIDYGIPVTAAKLSEENNISTFIVVSALGADKNSRIFYNRVKGDMEEAVISKDIKYIYVMQPSLIGGNREENRLGEKIAKFFMNLVEPIMFGDLKKYRTIEPETIALAMLKLSKEPTIDESRIESDLIKQISEAHG